MAKNKKGKLVRATIAFREALIDRVDILAEAVGTNRASWIRGAVIDKLAAIDGKVKGKGNN